MDKFSPSDCPIACNVCMPSSNTNLKQMLVFGWHTIRFRSYEQNPKNMCYYDAQNKDIILGSIVNTIWKRSMWLLREKHNIQLDIFLVSILNYKPCHIPLKYMWLHKCSIKARIPYLELLMTYKSYMAPRFFCGMFIISMYSLFILDDIKPSSIYFQFTLCGCQERNTLQDNKLSLSTKRPYHNLYSCCTISIYIKKRSKSNSKKV